MNQPKIGTFEAIMLILSIIVAHTVLSLPNVLVNSTKSATLLNIIFVSFLAFLFVLFLSKIFKKFPGLDILDISNILGSKILKNILGFIFIAYFIISSSVFLRIFCECLQIVYFPSTNIIFIILIFLLTICIVAHLEFNSSFKANLLIIPAVLLSIFLLFAANFDNFNVYRIFPILGNGFKETFLLGITNIYSFSGIAIIYLLPPLLKEPKDFKKISTLSIIISSVYLLLVVSIIVFMFPVFVQIDEILPLFTVASYVEFGSFFQRLESIFLFIWMLGFICYLSIVLEFSMLIFKKLTKIKYMRPIIYPFGLTMLGISLLPKNYSMAKFYETKIYPYLMIAVVFVLPTIILLLSYFKQRKKKVNKYE